MGKGTREENACDLGTDAGTQLHGDTGQAGGPAVIPHTEMLLLQMLTGGTETWERLLAAEELRHLRAQGRESRAARNTCYYPDVGLSSECHCGSVYC